MKYGYLFYRRNNPYSKKSIFVNHGDPLQSLAVIEIYKKMGIADRDIIPVDLVDLPNYSGEECVLVFNGPKHEDIYPQFAPIPAQIQPVFISFSVRTQLTKEELSDLRSYAPVGCRDEESVSKLRELGVNAFLSGCLTLTFPRRAKTNNQNTIFIVDVPKALIPLIPNVIKENAVYNSHVEHMSTTGKKKFTIHETEFHHKAGYAFVNKYRDEAKMVITSRLHCAAPCLAMGIPVILVSESFDARFGFIDKFLPLYTPDKFHSVDWNPKPVEMEVEKKTIEELCISKIKSVILQCQVHKMFMERTNGVQEYCDRWNIGVKKINFKYSRYAIWGMDYTSGLIRILPMIAKYHPGTVFYKGIDEEISGQYNEIDIIHPNEISKLPGDVVVIAITETAREAAKELAKVDAHVFILLDRASVEYCSDECEEKK